MNLKKGKDYIGVGCGSLIVNEKGEVLLMERGIASNNEAGVWSQPGGTVEFGESIKDAIVREIKEGLDVDIKLGEFLAVTDHIISEEHQHWVAVSYRGKIVSGDPKIMEPEKISALKWFDLKEVPQNLTLPTKDSIEALRKMI